MARTGNGESVLSRIVRILQAFNPETPALRVSDVARRSGLYVATASRLIEEMVAYGWLSRDLDRKIRLGITLWELASRASPAMGLREAAMPFLEDLHAVVGHHVQLAVLDGDEVLFVERLSAANSVVNITRIGGRLPLHASASGLVLLAHAAVDLQERILSKSLRPYTSKTITDARRLRRCLADIRRSGFALCPGFIDNDATGIAVPLRGVGNEVVGALSVVVPIHGDARPQILALQAAARGIARRLRTEDAGQRSERFIGLDINSGR